MIFFFGNFFSTSFDDSVSEISSLHIKYQTITIKIKTNLVFNTYTFNLKHRIIINQNKMKIRLVLLKKLHVCVTASSILSLISLACYHENNI